MQVLLYGRVFDSVIATHTIRMLMDASGYLVTIHVELKIPPGFPISPEEVPHPLDLETRCPTEEDAEEVYNHDCDMVLSTLTEAIANIGGFEGVGIESYPIKTKETIQ